MGIQEYRSPWYVVTCDWCETEQFPDDVSGLAYHNTRHLEVATTEAGWTELDGDPADYQGWLCPNCQTELLQKEITNG